MSPVKFPAPAYNKNARSASERVRAKLNHPVVDADGHTIEVEAVFFDYLKQVGGANLVQRYADMVEARGHSAWYKQSPQQLKDRRVQRPSYWFVPSRTTTDRATAMIPGVFRSRMDEFGIDYSIVFPTISHLFVEISDDELRPAICRAANVMNADLLSGHKDRLAPVAVIPLVTPEEGIRELEYAVNELGIKVISIQGNVRRPIADRGDKAQGMTRGGLSYWIDNLALDSMYDYDPFWRRCVELGVAPACHSGSIGWANRTSISSFVYNHIGHFANQHEAVAKAMLLGGVTNRFPQLRMAYLEGGIAWAISLYHSIIEHYEKRNVEALETNLNPGNIDRDELVKLIRQHGGKAYESHLEEIRQGEGPFLQQWAMKPEPDSFDEFALSQLKSKKDIKRKFADRFYFGCEADDKTVPWAFKPELNRGATFHPMLGSDIGHFDVTDPTECIAEAHELVEEGHLNEDQFKAYVFDNVVSLHGHANPNFFKGTVVEDAAAKVLAAQKSAIAAE